MPVPSGPVAGVVLAAGSSSRMGRNKLLLEFEGQTLLRRVVSRTAAAGLEPIIVVVGFEADRAIHEMAGLPCRAVLNQDYQRGLAGSLLVGLRALPAIASAAMVLLADMPYVSTGMLETMVQRYRATGSRLVISNYGGVYAPPILYHRSFFPELEALEGTDAGKDVIHRHLAEAEVVSWSAAALQDLDLPVDYDRARASLS